MKSPKLYALGLFLVLSVISFSSLGYSEEENAQPVEQQDPYQIPAPPPETYEAPKPAPAAAATQQMTPADQAAEDADAERELSEEEKNEMNFRSKDAYLDHYEAIRSKQYVRRAILSSVITATNKVAFDRMYINHLLGFHAIYQKTVFAKYVSGVQGLSVGYVFKSGHALEAGMDFSSLNNIFAGYRYFYRPQKFLLWPFAGAGLGYDVGLIKIAEGPPEAQTYAGAKEMGFVTLGVLVPLVDVAIKAEVRACAYKTDRFVLTQGIGAIIFF